MNNNSYNKKLKGLARNRRKNPTKAEVYLWKFVLSRGQLNGFKFKRQRSIGNYIADFFCGELNLIIEVDGFSHIDKAQSDTVRQNELESMGFKVLRFTDDEVINNLDGIKIYLYNYTKFPLPHPSPKRGFDAKN